MAAAIDPAPALASGAGRATVLLVLLRIAYAYNWFDIGPAFPALTTEFGLSPADWGVLLAAFLVGAGMFQVPSGLLARRMGTRAVSLLGAVLLGVAGAASALAPDFAALALLRFVAGAGAGLFFSPAIALVGSLHPPGRRGLPVGVFSSAFSAGAGLGVFGSAVLIPIVGWRDSLALGGLVVLALAALGVLAIPRSAGAPPSTTGRGPGRRLPAILRARSVWAIGLAFVGLEGASISAGQYFVPFAEGVHGWVPAVAGGLAALFVFPSFFGGPIGGRLAERDRRRRTQMLLATAVPGLLLVLVPVAGLLATAAIAVTFSLGYGMVYAMMYILPYYLPAVTPDDVPLAIGLFNGIQLAGGAGVSLLTGWVIGAAGFTRGWEVLGLLVVVPLAILSAVPPTGTIPNESVAGRPGAATGPASGGAGASTP